jgi:hypothetical protein
MLPEHQELTVMTEAAHMGVFHQLRVLMSIAKQNDRLDRFMSTNDSRSKRLYVFLVVSRLFVNGVAFNSLLKPEVKGATLNYTRTNTVLDAWISYVHAAQTHIHRPRPVSIAVACVVCIYTSTHKKGTELHKIPTQKKKVIVLDSFVSPGCNECMVGGRINSLYMSLNIDEADELSPMVCQSHVFCRWHRV